MARSATPAVAAAREPAPGAYWSLLDEPTRAVVLAAGQPRQFARGRAIMHAGQVPTDVHLLRSGIVKVCDVTPEGRELLLAFRAPGDLIGELSAIDDQPRSATIIAVEETEVVAIAIPRFRALLAEHPAASLALLKVVGARLREADARRLQFGRLGAMARVAVCLVELADRFGAAQQGAVAIPVPLTQEELAGWAGASIESTARALKQMRDLGWVETRRREIRVLDRAALEAAAG